MPARRVVVGAPQDVAVGAGARQQRGAEERQVVEENALEGLAVLAAAAGGVARFFEDAVAAEAGPCVGVSGGGEGPAGGGDDGADERVGVGEVGVGAGGVVEAA